MSKLKKLTSNDYTFNDVFTKHYQIWAMIPLFLYLLTPVVHMIVYAILHTDDIEGLDNIAHFLSTCEYPGDYYSPICAFSFVLGAFFAIIAVLSYYKNKKENKLKRYPDNVPTFIFLAYLTLIVVSTIANKTDYHYILGFTPRAEGVVSFFAYYLVFYLCGTFVTKEKYKYAAIYFFLATGVVIGVLTIINEYVTNVPIIGDYEYPCGIFYTHNFYAYYLSISIMLAAGLVALSSKKVSKIFGFIVMTLDTFILAINDSMGGFLACMVAFLFLVVAASIVKKKFSVASLLMFVWFLAIIFVTGLFTPSFFSEITGLANDVEKIVTDSEDAGNAGTLRWTLWTHTWQYIKEKPFVGWGFEGTAERLGMETHTDKAHNEYLENMAYYGIPAGLIYIAALVSVYLKAFTRRKKLDGVSVICLTGALAYIGSALVGNSFIFTAPFCFVFLGLGASTIHDTAKIPSKDQANEGQYSPEITQQ